jgi:hypothetical protein
MPEGKRSDLTPAAGAAPVWPADAPDRPRYLVRRVAALPQVSVPWDDPAWSRAETLTVGHFHARGTGSPGRNHTPLTQARLLHDGQALAMKFRVEDRYVLARSTTYQSPTHRDSCVEAFLRPLPARGYCNFEFNAIGTLLLWYIDKPRRPDGSFESYIEVPEALASSIAMRASLTESMRAEHAGPLVWTISARVPFTLFEALVGPIGNLSGQMWRANFYKCADDSSHPHWGSWAEIGERLDFHQPDLFGAILFE